MKFAVALFGLSGLILVQGLPHPEERDQSDIPQSAGPLNSAPEIQSSEDEKIFGSLGTLGTIALVGALPLLLNRPQTTIIMPTQPTVTSTVVLPPNSPASTTTVVVQPPSPPRSCGTMNSINQMPCYQFNTGCYCISQTPAAWRTAFDTCAAGGRQLLNIDSLTKAIDLQNNLQLVVGINTALVTQGWWTSGLYTLALNNFVWASTGATFTFTNWAAGNPITPTAAQLANGVCVHVAANSLITQFWDEQSCNAQFPFICQ